MIDAAFAAELSFVEQFEAMEKYLVRRGRGRREGRREGGRDEVSRVNCVLKSSTRQ